MKKYLVPIFLVLISGLTAQQAIFKGVVIDEKSKEPVPFANVSLKLGYDVVKNTNSDFEGHFEIDDIDPYIYRLIVSSVGFQQYNLDSLILKEGEKLYMEIKIKRSPVVLDEFVVVDYKVPLIDKDKTQNDVTVTSEEITKMPNQNANSMATTVGGVYAEDSNKNSVNGAKEAKPNRVNELTEKFTNQITATEINDFSKWDLWKNIEESEFEKYSDYWNIHLNERYVVEVVNENNAPLIGMNVKLFNKSGTIIWESRTDNTGKAELWSFGLNNKARKT
jgi:hypothetical protein